MMTATEISPSITTNSVAVRERLDAGNQSVMDYLNDWLEYIRCHRAVRHPVLNYYQNTRQPFTKQQEKQFYLECWYYFRFEPFFVAAIALNTRDYNILREVAMNIMDEVGETSTHEEQFRQDTVAIR